MRVLIFCAALWLVMAEFGAQPGNASASAPASAFAAKIASLVGNGTHSDSAQKKVQAQYLTLAISNFTPYTYHRENWQNDVPISNPDLVGPSSASAAWTGFDTGFALDGYFVIPGSDNHYVINFEYNEDPQDGNNNFVRFGDQNIQFSTDGNLNTIQIGIAGTVYVRWLSSGLSVFFV